MNKPLVSIITPVFNGAKHIQASWDCLLQQTESNFEWIIIDDCSTDDTAEICKHLSNMHKNIKFIHLQENRGAAYARNEGIKSASGRYICFLDVDDLWVKEKIEKQISFMTSKNISFSCSQYYVKSPSKETRVFSPKKDVIAYKDLLKTCSIGCSTVMLDTDIIGKVYMPLDAPKREDHATWLDITKRGFCCYVINEPLAHYYLSDKSVSSKKMRMFRYQYIMYRKHLKFNVLKSLYLTFLVAFNKVFFKYN